jgi:hypothetical protein
MRPRILLVGVGVAAGAVHSPGPGTSARDSTSLIQDGPGPGGAARQHFRTVRNSGTAKPMGGEKYVMAVPHRK